MCLDRCSEPYQLPEHIFHSVRGSRMAPRLELRIDPCALGGGRAIPPRLDLDPEPDPPAGVPDIEVGDPRGHHRPLGLAGTGDVTAERLERPDDLPLDPLLGGSSHHATPARAVPRDTWRSASSLAIRSGTFALASAAAIGGQTELPTILTCSALVSFRPSAPRSIV